VVVLAGGRSRRFGSDKLLAVVGHRASIVRVVERVTPIASHVSVWTSDPARADRLAGLLPAAVVVHVDDPGLRDRGPGEAIAHALQGGDSGPLLFVPGDMPWIETAALTRFAKIAETGHAQAAVPYWSSGDSENLVQWHASSRNARFLPAVPPPRASDRRASEILRAVPRTLFVPAHRLSSTPRCFSHLTRPTDVRVPSSRGFSSADSLPILVDGPPKRNYARAQRDLRSGDSIHASRSFLAESLWYAGAGLEGIADHALSDALACGPSGRRGASAVGARPPRPLASGDRQTVNRRKPRGAPR
jgi:molybdopterin-guanine dinucleotide biosynthesis protein A